MGFKVRLISRQQIATLAPTNANRVHALISKIFSFALFASLTAGSAPAELTLRRADGKLSGQSHQQRALVEASEAANLEPEASFHILRHTYASALEMKGVPAITAQLGDSDTRITEKHYAHLAPSYVTDTAMLPDFGSRNRAW